MGLGSDAGLHAAQEVHTAIDDALPQAHQILIEAMGSLERAAGALATTVSSLPGAIGQELDGVTISMTPIIITMPTITITRRPVLTVDK